MSTRERLSKLRNEIDELLSEVEKTSDLNIVLERLEQLESKVDKIDALENMLKTRTEVESTAGVEDFVEKIGALDSKIEGIREDISSLKAEFTNEITSLRRQVGNIIEAIIDLVKTIAPEIVKPETEASLEPLENITESHPETEKLEKPEEASSPLETIPEITPSTHVEPPPEEQTARETPTILTQLEETDLPERIEEEPLATEESSEISEVDDLSLRTEVEGTESELDSFVRREDKEMLNELGLDMIEYTTERVEPPEQESSTPPYVQLTNLEMRKIKLEREIKDLKTMIQAGFSSPEDEKRLDEKIREKEEIERQIQEISGRTSNPSG
ncbi:MAG: hypothetical protein ACTSRV_05000 [Candidatus Freyarchaeota archaeon]